MVGLQLGVQFLERFNWTGAKRFNVKLASDGQLVHLATSVINRTHFVVSTELLLLNKHNWIGSNINQQVSAPFSSGNFTASSVKRGFQNSAGNVYLKSHVLVPEYR